MRSLSIAGTNVCYAYLQNSGKFRVRSRLIINFCHRRKKIDEENHQAEH
jgi:hypothetical protein